MSKRRRYLDDNPPQGATSFEKALYNSIDPTGDYPINKFKAIPYFIRAKSKQLAGEEDIKDYNVGNSLGAKVAEAAWAKRLNMPYDENLLPIWNGDTVRLPYELEQEIPTDTNFIKNRIEANKELINKFPSKYRKNTLAGDIVRSGIKEDELTLEALRKTYNTGKPVGISEMSSNNRQLIKNGEVDENYISPLNVLKNYNIRYDKNTNRMYYSDEYDFNQFEKYIPGKSFRIRGYVDLNKKSLGGSIRRSLKYGGIYIQPSHRGRFTALKERTGHSATWFKENGTPAQKKMATFALNAAKWKH